MNEKIAQALALIERARAMEERPYRVVLPQHATTADFERADVQERQHIDRIHGLRLEANVLAIAGQAEILELR